MSWQLELPIIVRTWINDLSDTPTYEDDRLQQVLVVSAQYVNREINFTNDYEVNLTNYGCLNDKNKFYDSIDG